MREESCAESLPVCAPCGKMDRVALLDEFLLVSKDLF